MKTPIKIALIAMAMNWGFVALADDDDDDRAATPPSHGASVGKLPPASTKTGVTYAADIKPILDASCVDCHSGNRAKARLHLDTLEGVLKGGKEGKILTPGDSTKSLMVRSTAHITRDPEDWMPPLHNKEGIKPLLPEEISLIRAWIDQGAK